MGYCRYCSQCRNNFRAILGSLQIVSSEAGFPNCDNDLYLSTARITLVWPTELRSILCRINDPGMDHLPSLTNTGTFIIDQMRTLTIFKSWKPNVCLFMEVLLQTSSDPLSHFLLLSPNPVSVPVWVSEPHIIISPTIVSQPLIGLWLLSSQSPFFHLSRAVQWNVLIGW